MELLAVTNEQIDAHFEKLDKASISLPRTDHSRKVIQYLLETPTISPRRDRTVSAIKRFLNSFKGGSLLHELDAFPDLTAQMDEYHRTACKLVICGGGIEARDNYLYILANKKDELVQIPVGEDHAIDIYLVSIGGELGIAAGSVIYL